MTISKISQLTVVAAATLGILGFASFAAQAQNSDTLIGEEATVEVLAAITLQTNEGGPLSFGIVVRPTAGTATFTVDNADGIAETGGSDGVTVSGHQSGNFTVGGTIGALATLTLTETGVCGSATNGIAWEAASLTSDYGGTITGGSLDFKVGGSIEVDFDADTTIVPVVCTYNLLVEYD